MNRIIFSTTLTIAATAPFMLHAEDSPADGDDLNRFTLGPRLGMNFQAKFHNNAGVAFNPGPDMGPNHQYLDGYVRVDSSGNAGGLTWNWGYQNASQVVGDTMQFHTAPYVSSASSPGNGSDTSDSEAGLELVYQRVLGHLPFGRSTRWGLETGFGYTDIDLHDDDNGIETTSVATDAYPLNGVLPPSAGYQGTFQGPGALLGDTPTRTTTSIFTAMPSHQKLSGQLYTLRLGPFAEWNFTHRFSLAGSVGLTLAPACLDYDFSDGVASAGGFSTASGHASKTSLLYGPYVDASLRYDFTHRWGVYVGAQFQSLNDMELSTGGHTAKLDAGAAVYLTAGLSYKF